MSHPTTVNTQSRSVAFQEINHRQVFVVSDLVPDSPKLVLMSHGFRGTSTGPARQFVDFSTHLNQNGISTVRFDQPCSGNSEGDYLNSSFNDWVATTTYLAGQYVEQGYQVALMGQSMGASTSVVASADPGLQGKIAALLLWVPDPKSAIKVERQTIYEEAGQLYQGKFWTEARQRNFYGCLDKFTNPIHLVYGEQDRYIPLEVRRELMQKVQAKQGEIMLLTGEDHSPWSFENAQRVMAAELRLLESVFTD